MKKEMRKVNGMKVTVGILGAVLILVTAQLAAQLLVQVLDRLTTWIFEGFPSILHIVSIIMNITAGILYFGFAYVLLKVFAEKLLNFRLCELGIPRFKLNMKWLITAFVLPAAVIAVYLILPGEFGSSGMTEEQTAAVISAGIFFTGIAGGAVEEMVFRGFIMNLLGKKLGRKAAVLLPSLLFGALHIIGMDLDLVSCIQVLAAGTCVGIMFSLIAIDQNSVWNSAVVHTIWNISIIGGILHIGENLDEYSAMTYILKTDSFFITGGEFGIEASVIAIAGYLVVCVLGYPGARKRIKKIW